MSMMDALYRAFDDLRDGRRASDLADDAASRAGQARDSAAVVVRQRRGVLRAVAMNCGLAGAQTTDADVASRAHVALAMRGYCDPPEFVPQGVFDEVREALAEFAPDGASSASGTG